MPYWYGKVKIWVQHAAPWLSWQVAGIEETKMGLAVQDCSAQCPRKGVEPVTGSEEPTAPHLFHFALQQPHQEHDVVWGAWHKGAPAAHLQESGAAGAAGGTGQGEREQGGRGSITVAPRLSSLLQCDGVLISLPSLQGIAVLNIPSYAGGINFWGGTKEDNVSASIMK